MLNFVVNGNEKIPEPTRQETILTYKEGIEKVKNNTSPNRPVYIDEILRVINSKEFTQEELDLSDNDIKYLEDELAKIREKRALTTQISFLMQDIYIEKRKFFGNKKLLREKALEIQRLIVENNLSYEECNIDPLMISELIK